MNSFQSLCTAVLVSTSGCGKLSNVTVQSAPKTHIDVVERIEHAVYESFQDSIMNVRKTEELLRQREQAEYEKRHSDQYDLHADTLSSSNKLLDTIFSGVGLGEIAIKMPLFNAINTDTSETIQLLLPRGKQIAFYPTLFSIEKEGTIYRISKFGLPYTENEETWVNEYMVALPESILINEGMLDLLSDSTYDSIALQNRKQSDIKLLLKILLGGSEVTFK